MNTSEIVVDHTCPSSGHLHKIIVKLLGFGVDSLPKTGALIEYYCPVCEKTHQFTISTLSGLGTPFPRELYLSGRIIEKRPQMMQSSSKSDIGATPPSAG
jgi:hypothetical protein